MSRSGYSEDYDDGDHKPAVQFVSDYEVDAAGRRSAMILRRLGCLRPDDQAWPMNTVQVDIPGDARRGPPG